MFYYLIIIKYVPGGGVVGISKVFADVSSVGVSLEGAEGSGGAGVLAADASFGGGASPIRERFTNQWLEIKLLFSTLTLAVPDVLTAVTVMNMFHVICLLRGQEHELFIIINILGWHLLEEQHV